MNKNLKRALQIGFEAPPPVRREDFLCAAPVQPVGMFSFLCTQARYIPRWVWWFSGGLFMVSLGGSCVFRKDVLWMLSAFMPLLALTLLAEGRRSERFCMAELEQASRFSIKSVVLARLVIMGVENLLMVGLLFPLALKNNDYNLAQAGIYLTVPYLLTAYLGAGVLRSIRGREGDLACVGIAVFVSAGSMLLRQNCPFIYEKGFIGWWLAAGLFLVIGGIYRCGRMARKEELTWSL